MEEKRGSSLSGKKVEIGETAVSPPSLF